MCNKSSYMCEGYILKHETKICFMNVFGSLSYSRERCLFGVHLIALPLLFQDLESNSFNVPKQQLHLNSTSA